MTRLKYSIDTRTIQPGEYFVAILGDRYDGHNFIPQAIEKGAIGLIVEKDVTGLGLPAHIVIKQVQDTIHYLAGEAHKLIEKLQTDVIAITGSVGKTTTKNAIATVLRQAFPVVTSKGNLNTLLGLSLTVLNQLSDNKQKLVVEMGTYQKGNIAHLCYFIPPAISVITNIHPVHLEKMGTMENITLAKREAVEALPPKGIACLNWDDSRVRTMADHCRGRAIFYGQQPGADFVPERITVDIPLLGSYKIYPALAAFCVGHCLGLPDNIINQGLSKLTPNKGRLVKLPGINKTTLLDDTYNASLVSTLVALEALSNQPTKRRIAFLGDMLELGDEEAVSHRQIVKSTIEVADRIILVGPRMSLAARQMNTPQDKQIFTFENSNNVVTALKAGQVYQPEEGDCILVKGSAGVRMERVAQCLLSPEIDANSTLVRQEASWKDI